MEQIQQSRNRLSLARAWALLRQIVGWICIILGLLGLVLPLLQGVLFLAIGVALVGPRNWLIRRASVALRLLLRRWAALPHPLIGPAGRLARRAQWRMARQQRRMQAQFQAWYAEQQRSRANRRLGAGTQGSAPAVEESDVSPCGTRASYRDPGDQHTQ